MVNQDELRVLLRETVREMVAEELQALLFLEREAFIQEGKRGRKNGTYPGKLLTPFGEVELRVPRDGQGRFRPSLFVPYARRTVDLSDPVLVLYAVGGVRPQGGGGDDLPAWAPVLLHHGGLDRRACAGKGGSDLKRDAESHEEAHAAWQTFGCRSGGRYPEVVRSWEENLRSLLRFFRYPKALWVCLRSTNLLERFMRKLKRGTRVRDHQFPKPEAVYKLVYLECERKEGKRRKLKDEAFAREQLEQVFPSSTLRHKM